jgi:hypothetical protein
MFLPILLVWMVYRRFWKGIFGFVAALLISAFYVLPVIFESKFVSLGTITAGYFDFRAHFITLYQIFISRFWGYGGSTWGSGDGLSLSVGHVQWILPLIILIFILVKRKFSANKDFLILMALGLFCLFLTHNRSTFVWTHIPGMAYIQFPWRFLGVATFCLAASTGAIIQFFEKRKIVVSVVIVVAAIALNLSFFREDIWYKINDSFYTTGEQWDLQRDAAINDYWPLFGHKVPNVPSDGKYINYFPGWESTAPVKDGLIPSQGAVFKNTPVRSIGNVISLLSVIAAIIIVVRNRTKK